MLYTCICLILQVNQLEGTVAHLEEKLKSFHEQESKVCHLFCFAFHSTPLSSCVAVAVAVVSQLVAATLQNERLTHDLDGEKSRNDALRQELRDLIESQKRDSSQPKDMVARADHVRCRACRCCALCVVAVALLS